MAMRVPAIRPHRPCADGRNTFGHDGNEKTGSTTPISAVRSS
jgi:hypothetical protein